MSRPVVPLTTLEDTCGEGRLWIGCVGFGLLLVIRSCTSFCFALAACRCRSIAGKVALFYVAAASFSLHMVRRVLPYVPIHLPTLYTTAAQVADTAGISGVAWLVVTSSWVGGACGASGSVLLELLVVAHAGTAYSSFEKWSRRFLRALSAVAIPLVTLLRMRACSRKEIAGYILHAVVAGVAFPIMIACTGSSGILWHNTICAIIWHGFAASLLYRSIEVMEDHHQKYTSETTHRNPFWKRAALWILRKN